MCCPSVVLTHNLPFHLHKAWLWSVLALFLVAQAITELHMLMTPPPPPAFVSFSLAYEGNAVILQTCTEKPGPVFVNQPTACSYFSARHRSASLRTVRLLLSLLPPLILFHPLRVVSTHAYSLKLTPTCTHSHVHSVFIFFPFRCWISYCRCVVSVTISSVHPFTVSVPVPAILFV